MRRSLAWTLVFALIAGCGGATPVLGQGPAGGRASSLEDARASGQHLDGAMDAVGTRTLPGNKIALFVDGREAFPALEQAVREAKRSIWFETFMWHNDRWGQRLAKLLAQRKDEGLDVRALVDPMGLAGHKGDRDVLRVMLDHQVPVRLYKPRILGSLGNITHRKLYLMDGERGFTGGMNLGDPYADVWHDLLVDVQGPSARDMHRAFAANWNVSGTPDLPEDIAVESAPRKGEIRIRTLETDLNAEHGGRDLVAAEMAALGAAKRTIRVAQVFMSDEAMIARLEQAARRGVDVRVLIGAEVNLSLFRLLNRYYGRRLTNAGVKVRWYEQRYSHVKFVSVDGAWTMLGSANMDTRSYELNQELSLGISSPEFANQADRRVFDHDWVLSRAPGEAELSVPLAKRPIVLLADWLSYFI